MATPSTAASFVDTNRRYSVRDSLVLLGISKKLYFARVKAGHIKIIKDGRRTFTPGSEIARLSQVPTT